MKISKLLILKLLFLTNVVISGNFEIFDKSASEYLNTPQPLLEKYAREDGDPLASFALSIKHAENFKKFVNQNNYKNPINVKHLVTFFEWLITGSIKLVLYVNCYNQATKIENIITKVLDDKYIKSINTILDSFPIMEKDLVNKCCKSAINNTVEKIQSEITNNSKKFNPKVINKYFNSRFIIENENECNKNSMKLLVQWEQDVKSIINYDSKILQANYLKIQEEECKTYNN